MSQELHYAPFKESNKLYEDFEEKKRLRYDTGEVADYSKETANMINEFAEKIKVAFEREYKKAEGYFYGCNSNVYKETYFNRLKEFNSFFVDSEEIDFIKEELEVGIFQHKFKDFNSSFFDYDINDNFQISIEDETDKHIYYSLKKRFAFLQDRANKNGYNLVYDDLQGDEIYSLKPISSDNDENNKKTFQSVEWKGTVLQFTELIKALKESNLISPELNQKELFKRFKEFMNVDDYSESDKLKDIRKRTKDKAPLINLLETALNNWIHSKD